jgi:hypothetical protein
MTWRSLCVSYPARVFFGPIAITSGIPFKPATIEAKPRRDLSISAAEQFSPAYS